ncbi:MAG TPA: hypothetical protein VEL49_03805 [Ktedonobacteraceae bacterium]|nr:hypothetical protein [Ktedonobacteraceae bacterium]
MNEPETTRLHNLAVNLALEVIFDQKIKLDDEVIEHLSVSFREALKHLQGKGH